MIETKDAVIEIEEESSTRLGAAATSTGRRRPDEEREEHQEFESERDSTFSVRVSLHLLLIALKGDE